MCFAKSPAIPRPLPPVFPKEAPTRINEAVLAARGGQKRLESLRRGILGTRLTGPSGFTLPAQTAQKTLLGQ